MVIKGTSDFSSREKTNKNGNTRQEKSKVGKGQARERQDIFTYRKTILLNVKDILNKVSIYKAFSHFY